MQKSFVDEFIVIFAKCETFDSCGHKETNKTVASCSNIHHPAMCFLWLLVSFSLLPNVVNSQCTNGGTLVATGCTTSAQCTPYTTLPVVCLNSLCCTTTGTSTATCTNGGQLVATGCTTAQQCTAYTTSPVICLNGQCCTTLAQSNTCPNGGQLVATGCTVASQCTAYTSSPVSCLNGLCCTVS